MTSPIIISTWSFGQRGNQAAWPNLAKGGSSLDAVEKACTAVEEDSDVDSVGFGGLPDEQGEISLDAAIMLSPKQCGSVCYVRKYLHVTKLARLVMEKTDHILLAGEGAEKLAEHEGLKTSELVSEQARDKWEKWQTDPKRKLPNQVDDSGLSALRPVDMDGSGQLFHQGDDEARWVHHDTIGTLALDNNGVLAGACSTSGTPYKTPGRVGDSPIIGHGLYVDPHVGAVVGTGSGELIMGICGSFLITELMRNGAIPADAIKQTLIRIEESYDLTKRDQAAFLILKNDGTFHSGALRKGFKVAVNDSNRDEILDPDYVHRED